MYIIWSQLVDRWEYLRSLWHVLLRGNNLTQQLPKDKDLDALARCCYFAGICKEETNSRQAGRQEWIN